MRHRGRTNNMNRTNNQINLIYQLQTTRKTLPIKIENPVIDDKPKMKWGEPVWFLFHTLAEKVKQDQFPTLKEGIMNIIRSICNSLPCPICAEHATKYMKGIQDNSIRTKEDLKLMLFNFHNEINKRKGYDMFPLNELALKYKKAVTIKVINYFITTYKEKSRNIQMIATEMNRDRVIRNIRQWLNVNLNHFDT